MSIRRPSRIATRVGLCAVAVVCLPLGAGRAAAAQHEGRAGSTIVRALPSAPVPTGSDWPAPVRTIDPQRGAAPATRVVVAAGQFCSFGTCRPRRANPIAGAASFGAAALAAGWFSRRRPTRIR